MREAIRTITIAWVMLLGLSPTVPAFAQDLHDPAERRERIEQLIADHEANDRIQTERPEFKPEAPEFRDRKPNPIIEAIGKFFAWLFTNFGGVFKLLVVVVIAGAVAYALFYMFRDIIGVSWLQKRQKPRTDISEIGNDRPDEGRAVALLDQADALAAEGRFAEAVHLLLFRSIEDLRERRSGGVPKSLTAREIQSLADLSQRARQALAPIIGIVERSFFGGCPVDQTGWQQARSSYEQFAFGEVTA